MACKVNFTQIVKNIEGGAVNCLFCKTQNKNRFCAFKVHCKNIAKF